MDIININGKDYFKNPETKRLVLMNSNSHRLLYMGNLHNGEIPIYPYDKKIENIKELEIKKITKEKYLTNDERKKLIDIVNSHFSTLKKEWYDYVRQILQKYNLSNKILGLIDERNPKSPNLNISIEDAVNSYVYHRNRLGKLVLYLTPIEKLKSDSFLIGFTYNVRELINDLENKKYRTAMPIYLIREQIEYFEYIKKFKNNIEFKKLKKYLEKLIEEKKLIEEEKNIKYKISL
jgi:hypothetical protein